MMETIIIVLSIIIVSWILDAFKDAIDFGSPIERWMKSLWHLAKGVSYYIPYCALIYYSGVSLWWCLGIIPIMWVFHEVPYRIFRYIEVWRWDRAFKSRLICWLWGIPYDRGR